MSQRNRGTPSSRSTLSAFGIVQMRSMTPPPSADSPGSGTPGSFGAVEPAWGTVMAGKSMGWGVLRARAADDGGGYGYGVAGAPAGSCGAVPRVGKACVKAPVGSFRPGPGGRSVDYRTDRQMTRPSAVA